MPTPKSDEFTGSFDDPDLAKKFYDWQKCYDPHSSIIFQNPGCAMKYDDKFHQTMRKHVDNLLTKRAEHLDAMCKIAVAVLGERAITDLTLVETRHDDGNITWHFQLKDNSDVLCRVNPCNTSED